MSRKGCGFVKAAWIKAIRKGDGLLIKIIGIVRAFVSVQKYVGHTFLDYYGINLSSVY